MGEVEKDPFRAARLILLLRRAGVTDNALLAAMEQLPRSEFVAEDAADLAFEDAVLPIACGQTILRPTVTGQILQMASLSEETRRVLLVGLGSGYTAALIAQRVESVFAVERYRRLTELAIKTLSDLQIENVYTRHGDGLLGWEERGSFDRIILTGIYDPAPVALLQQLVPEGRLIQPIAEDSKQFISVFDSDGKALNSQKITGFQPLSPGIAREL